ncbi:unnamed protein product [Phytomonas sp. EM1]|nr:unnamed protein product [Phytomonas sp. EM1]|eukprot:CCW63867.1 unnamed protein product [Phytomonas sp. isolate EM1]
MDERYYPLGTRERYRFEERMRRAREARRKQLQEELHMSECTFQPKVHSSGASKGRASKHSKDERGREREAEGSHRHSDPNVSVFDRLARQAEELHAKSVQRERQKQREERDSRECSFRPQINTTPRLSRNSSELERQGRVEDRLLRYGRATERHKELQRRQKEEGRLSLSANGNLSSMDPESRRLAQREFEERNEELLRRREQKSAMAECEAPSTSFHPRISSNSIALDEAARARKAESGEESSRPLKRGELLYEKGMVSHVKKLQLAEELRRREEEELCHGHKPHINPYTNDWLQRSENQKFFAKDFISRQEIYHEAREELKDLLAEEEEAKRRQAFAHARVSSDTILSQVERLYNDAVKASKVKSSKAGDSFEKACPFKPELSKGSLQVLRKMPHREKDVVSRLTRPGSSTAKDEKEPSKRRLSGTSSDKGYFHSSRRPTSVEKRVLGNRGGPLNESGSDFEMDACHSQLSSSGRRVIRPEDAEAFFQRQIEAQRQREERIRQEQQKKEEEEMESCTFRPMTNAHSVRQGSHLGGRGSDGGFSSSPEGGEEICGVRLFVMRQEEARRRRAEKAELLANIGLSKAFCEWRSRRSGARSPIASMPFRVSTGVETPPSQRSTPELSDLQRRYARLSSRLVSLDSTAAPRTHHLPPLRKGEERTPD